MEQRSAETIIRDLKAIVESRKPLDRGLWLESEFYLSLLREDEAKKLNRLNQEVSVLILNVLKSQDKKNVAAAEKEISATDKYVEMKDQEARITTMDELIRVSKKNAETNY